MSLRPNDVLETLTIQDTEATVVRLCLPSPNSYTVFISME